MTHGKTWTALMLAASTLALSSLPLAAQESTTEEAATPDASAEGGTTTDLAAEGTTIEGEAAAGAETDVAQGEAGATGDAAAEGTMTAEEGTATATETEVQTDVAEGEAATGEAGAETTVTAEGAEAAGEDAATDTAGTQDTQTAAGDVPSEPTEAMASVLEQHAELGARPIEELSVEEARTQPTPADAVMAVMEEQGIEMPAELAAIATRDVTYPGADGSEQQARVYTPEGEGPFPLILYFHGGGWVIADIDTYDASARALAAGANAVVVSAHYRQAPENPFPAAHDDANAAFVHFVETSGEINADTERLAVAGESAGGNLAFNVAAYARDNQLTPIDHMLLVYPVAGNDMETASYQTNAEARPLSRAGMMWFVEHVFEDASQTADPRINLVGRDDFEGMPPATVILAEIDPLTTEGVTLASRLEEAGVPVQLMTYEGVTHEFFGMGAVVPEAQQAVDMATTALSGAFGDAAAPATADAATGEATTGADATADAATDGATGADATADAATDAATGADATADAATDGAADATTDGAATAGAATDEVTGVEATAAETPDAVEAEEGAATEEGAAVEGTTEPLEGEAATADQ